jgi:hypothetical protein
MLTLIQIAGALLVLVPFVASQAGVLSVRSVRYLVLNLIGSATLTVLALVHGDWGFLLLEGVWALVAARGLIARAAQPSA